MASCDGPYFDAYLVGTCCAGEYCASELPADTRVAYILPACTLAVYILAVYTRAVCTPAADNQDAGTPVVDILADTPFDTCNWALDTVGPYIIAPVLEILWSR